MTVVFVDRANACQIWIFIDEKYKIGSKIHRKIYFWEYSGFWFFDMILGFGVNSGFWFLTRFLGLGPGFWFFNTILGFGVQGLAFLTRF